MPVWHCLVQLLPCLLSKSSYFLTIYKRPFHFKNISWVGLYIPLWKQLLMSATCMRIQKWEKVSKFTTEFLYINEEWNKSSFKIWSYPADTFDAELRFSSGSTFRSIRKTLACMIKEIQNFENFALWANFWDKLLMVDVRYCQYNKVRKYVYLKDYLKSWVP